MANLSQLKNEYSNKKNSFEVYANRRDKINKIINSIEGDFDNEVSSVNKKINQCIENFRDGLNVEGSCDAQIINKLEKLKESSAESDSKLSSCKSNLNSEKNRCQTKINNLDVEIKSLKTQINENGGFILF